MKSKTSTTAKIGLVALVVVAGVVAVAANYGILTANRPSPDVGVLSATEVVDAVDATPSSVAPTTGTYDADRHGDDADADDHDGVDDYDSHDTGDRGKDHDKREEGADHDDD